jgi:outer membrane receptor protein involved in Fe transport
VFGTIGYDERTQRTVELERAIPALIDTTLFQKNRIDSASVSANHAIGFGDVTLQYGFDAQAGRTRADLSVLQIVTTTAGGAPNVAQTRDTGDFQAGRAFADLFWRPSDRFEAQAGVQYNVLDIDGATDDGSRILPRIGIGVSPFEGHWIRAAYRKESMLPVSFTLAPITTVGLVSNELPATLGGTWETMALRWDAEWSPRIFTAVEYQHQNARALDLPVASTLDTFPIDKASVDWLAATANVWLGYGIGVFGTIGATETEIEAGQGAGFDVPLIPRRFARAGLTFVHPSRVKFTLAETYIGERMGARGGLPLDDYWTTDASISWESPDRHLFVSATVLNLFETDYRLSPLVAGPGRTFAATMKTRF